ncbi:MAG TPA: hypothetical protein VF650_16060 [Allosphingosinicella sp.]|jgi:hypothetical protein
MTAVGGGMRERALEFIAVCSDPKKLEQVIRNARDQGEAEVERAAMLRLYEVKPEAQPGTLEHDVWRSIYALEGALTDERQRTTLLNRTRPKIKREGEAATVADLVLKKVASEGFDMLMERGMPELTFEALALRHPERFDDEVLKAASRRLAGAGVDPATFASRD